jgi:hypothetical protein
MKSALPKEHRGRDRKASGTRPQSTAPKHLKRRAHACGFSLLAPHQRRCVSSRLKAQSPIGVCSHCIHRSQTGRSRFGQQLALIPLVVERTDLPHPGGGSLSQFGMVFRLPQSGGFAQDFTLAAGFDFATGDLRQECAAAPFADEFVDVGD